MRHGKCFLTIPLPHPQFAEKFQEVKEAARLAREKSQDGGEFTSTGLALASHQVGVPAPHVLQYPMTTTPLRQPYMLLISGAMHCISV